MVPSPSLNAKISHNKDVLEGRAQVIKKSRVEMSVRDLKQHGWRTTGKGKDARIIVPLRDAGDYAEVVKDKRINKSVIKMHHVDGTTAVKLPSNIRTADELLRQYNANPETFERMKSDNDRFSARIYDNRITKTVFRDFGALLDYLADYEKSYNGMPGFWNQLTKGKESTRMNAFTALEIVRFPKSEVSTWTNIKPKAKRKPRKRKSR